MDGVSVILISYNGATRGYIEQAIESVLRQTHKNFELIIVDDGSVDDTEILCQKYVQSPQVTYLKQKNSGPAAARNLGIQRAQYDYITFLDDDDYFEKEMLAEMLLFFKNQHNENLGMIYCAAREVGSQNISFKSYSGEIFSQLLLGNFLTLSAVFIRKKIFNSVGVFCEYLKYSEDYDLWLRIAKKYLVVGNPQILVNRRVHTNQLSSDSEKMQVFHRAVLEKSLESETSNSRCACLYAFYMTYVKIFLGQNKYNDFRRELRSASYYGQIPLKWKIKYFLSFFPSIFQLTEVVVKRFQ